MAADALTPAVLSYIEHGAFPQDEDIASANLTADNLEHIRSALRQEQHVVKDEIRGLSKSTAGDVDTWIAKAKELQADILRSRETARQIVAQHEHTKEHSANVKETGKYVTELEREVGVYSSIASKLQAIKRVKVLLDFVQDALVSGDVDTGLAKLQEAEEEASINDLGDAQSGVGFMLRRRIDRLQDNLKTNVQERWAHGVFVSIEDRKVVVNDGLSKVINAARGLAIFDDLIARLAKDIERAVVQPRLTASRNGLVAAVTIEGKQLSCQSTSDDTSTESLFKDLHQMFDFFNSHLENDIALPLSTILVPRINARLEDDWLSPAVPIDIEDMSAFQDLLTATTEFADQIDALQWQGSKALRDWVQQAPKTWLTKRREAVLGNVRNLVFSGLRDRKTVERTETQTVSKEDHAALRGGDAAEDDWDAWEEPESSASPLAAQAVQQAVDDEDMSAWDDDAEEPSAPAVSKVSAGDEEDISAWDDPDPPAQDQPAQQDDDDGDAWGWDGEEEQPAVAKQPSSAKPVTSGATSAAPTDREVTLRETFTVTSVPDGILELLQQLITDAQTLAKSEYSASPISAAAAGLYSLPTLGLAIYRATAPTAYAKVDTGNFLIYNDALRLADQLRLWQASQPPASRLRLDNDVKALEQFAKRAYSAEMESQRTILQDMLEGAQDFKACSTQPAKQECEDAIQQTVFRLRDVHKMWAPILSSSALLQSVGNLLSTVAAKIILDVEELAGIGEADSKQLKLLIDQASEVKDLFMQNDRDMTFVYCPNWMKFQYLAEIMESSLADIRYMWNESELSMEFTAEEVVGLMEALFEVGPHLRQAIQDIRRKR
ncbi:putative RZZ complex, subunit Zw10 protein [Septoria linicola]|nr:putative RZZ complex, subunit Zw10 protein [Septoria linicola]